jgi:hypothetical protein
VVAPEEEEAFRILELVSREEEERVQRKAAAVDIIAHENPVVVADSDRAKILESGAEEFGDVFGLWTVTTLLSVRRMSIRQFLDADLFNDFALVETCTKDVKIHLGENGLISKNEILHFPLKEKNGIRREAEKCGHLDAFRCVGSKDYAQKLRKRRKI